MQELDTKSLLQVPFLFGLNNPKQPLCARTSFKNKVIRYFEIILFEILEKVYRAGFFCHTIGNIFSEILNFVFQEHYPRSWADFSKELRISEIL